MTTPSLAKSLFWGHFAEAGSVLKREREQKTEIKLPKITLKGLDIEKDIKSEKNKQKKSSWAKSLR